MNINETNRDTTATVPTQVAAQPQATTIVDGVDTNAFVPYDSALGYPELDGFRNVKCLYKVAKTGANAGKAAGTNSVIRIADGITEAVVQERVQELAPYIVGYLQEQENALVKKLHVAGMTVLSPKQYGLDAVIAALEESGASNRLNKEKIEDWFTASMLDALIVAFSDKMGVSETPSDAELEKLDSIINVYKSKFGSLASGKTHYRVEEAEMLLKALEITGGGDTIIGGKFVLRLERMKGSTPDDLLLSL